MKDEFTPRECEIFQLLKEFKSSKEIAASLNISERTVKFHIGNMLLKRGVATRNELTHSVSLGEQLPLPPKKLMSGTVTRRLIQLFEREQELLKELSLVQGLIELYKKHELPKSKKTEPLTLEGDSSSIN